VVGEAAADQAPPGMGLIPAGSFTMGNSLGDVDITDASTVTVNVSAFYMDLNLVTSNQWRSVYAYATNHGYTLYRGLGKAADHPVQSVDWFDCVKWCNARSQQAGVTPVYYTDAGLTQVFTNGDNGTTVYPNWAAKGYRLPTEAEWEKAARGGLSGQRFPWGNMISWNQANYYADPISVDPSGYAYDVNPTSGSDPTFNNGVYPSTSPVNFFAPNGYGLYDMAGNVWQWCWDVSGAYASGSQTDPRGPTSHSRAFRVFRGGGWDDIAFNCRTAVRNDYEPDISIIYFPGAGIDYYIGFRSVLPLVAPSNQGPSIVIQPTSQTAQAGSSATFSVTAYGNPSPNYQWQFNGQNLASQTAASLSLTNVQFANAGGYLVIVTNTYGSVTSATATLKLLAIDTNISPKQLNPNSIPSKQPSQDSLVIVTHGFIPLEYPQTMPGWVSELAGAISNQAAANWLIVPFDWSKDAWGISPDYALYKGGIDGALLGKQLSQTNWQQVHLIGHSAGAGVIQAIADALSTSPSHPRIQMTFLDPFVGATHQYQSVYGQNANWADCYSVEDFTGGFTAGGLAHAYNVDVSWVDPAHQTVPWGLSQVAFSTHEYAHEFYLDTMTNSSPSWCGYGYGYALSQETFLGWTHWGNLLPGFSPLMLCGSASALQNPSPGLASTLVALADANHAISSFGASLLSNTGFLLSSLTQGVLPHGVHPLVLTPATNSPGWLAVGLTVTNPVNYIQFDSGFTDTNAAQGLVTVYWDTNQIGMVDERVASTNVQTYRFMLPATVTSGSYVLGFRLDAFNNTASSVSITNVAMGFVGVTQPITLNLSLTNGVPKLQLTGPSGYSYLVQTSTNLVNWTPTALLLNTNGTSQFLDSAVTNSRARFYRVTMP
jgi:formylglycine-generating enzyme required for sulfatase activity